jgi:hypothetical protein
MAAPRPVLWVQKDPFVTQTGCGNHLRRGRREFTTKHGADRFLGHTMGNGPIDTNEKNKYEIGSFFQLRHSRHFSALASQIYITICPFGRFSAKLPCRGSV